MCRKVEMELDKDLQEQILQVVESQLIANDPPETKQAYKQLIESGISDKNAKIYISRCMAIEIYEALKNQQPFNQKRFFSYLKRLLEGLIE